MNNLKNYPSEALNNLELKECKRCQDLDQYLNRYQLCSTCSICPKEKGNDDNYWIHNANGYCSNCSTEKPLIIPAILDSELEKFRIRK